MAVNVHVSFFCFKGGDPWENQGGAGGGWGQGGGQGYNSGGGNWSSDNFGGGYQQNYGGGPMRGSFGGGSGRPSPYSGLQLFQFIKIVKQNLCSLMCLNIGQRNLTLLSGGGGGGGYNAGGGVGGYGGGQRRY